MATETTARTWRAMARPGLRKRALWAHANGATQWVECGSGWEAVAITPMADGLSALDRMRLGTKNGYPVLADHLRDVLYVLVPSGSAARGEGLAEVRVLSTGQHLLMPSLTGTTAAADWLSAPHTEDPPLVPGERLLTELRAQRTAGSPLAP